jgi:PII-like signaling protein
MLQLRFHFGERDRCDDGSLDAAVMDACARHGVRAAVLLRGVEGFGAKHRLRTDRLLSLSEDAPLVAVAVGESAVVEGLVEEVRGMATDGLLLIEGIEAMDGGASKDEGEGAEGVRGDREGGAPGDGAEGAEVDAAGSRGDVVKATIWGPRTGPTSPHFDAVAALHRHAATAATVLLGVDGVLDGERRRARLVAANRGVPAMTVAVGERAAIDAALAELDAAAHLVTVEAVVPFCRIETVSHHTTQAAAHDDSATRVTLMTSEIAACESHPLYVELIHRLRREGAAGATGLRGVWGFRGGGKPHGDRVLALRRDVPLLVEAVDTAERAARWRELALEIAGDQDVVYSQANPRVSPGLA